MHEGLNVADIPPRVRAQVLGVLADKLSALVDSAAEMVEPEHLVSGYLPDDPTMRHRFMVRLERAFSIPIDGNRFDSARTVGELADLIALKIVSRRLPGRFYVVCYQDASGRLVETRVRATNHEQAIEALRAEGLQQVVSVERDEDERDDEEPCAGRGHGVWSSCLLPLLAAVAVAAGAVAFFWWRRG